MRVQTLLCSSHHIINIPALYKSVDILLVHNMQIVFFLPRNLKYIVHSISPTLSEFHSRHSSIQDAASVDLTDLVSSVYMYIRHSYTFNVPLMIFSAVSSGILSFLIYHIALEHKLHQYF